MQNQATIDRMGDRNKKPRRGKGRPKDPKNVGVVPLFIEVEPDLKAALEKSARNERRTLKAQLTLLIEEAMARLGFWPPGGDKEHP
jgi:hypothetical protein